MLLVQWILEITDILTYKIVSFWYENVIQYRNLRGEATQNCLYPPPLLQYVRTALPAREKA